MENGISIYPGLDNTPEENLELLEKAAASGIRRIFTSLQIPETNREAWKSELGSLLKSARHHGMEVISDVSPAAMKVLGIKEFNFGALRMLGITTLRLDDGFGVEEIAQLSKNTMDMRIQLNASAITGNMLSALMNLGTDFRHVDALHNFYPRRGTGIGEETLVRKNVMLHKAGVRVGAFVPSRNRPRSPLFDGLPTLEEHRDEPAELAARHLIALGCDSVFLSDSMPTDEELLAIGTLRPDQVTMRAQFLTEDPVQRQLLDRPFTARFDEARDAVRAQESRGILRSINGTILPENTVSRPTGAVTLDNIDYGRYMGELQIIRTPQRADTRVNVSAMVDKEEVNLIQYITPGRRFSFYFHE